jgi:hypothetical protein
VSIQVRSRGRKHIHFETIELAIRDVCSKGLKHKDCLLLARLSGCLPPIRIPREAYNHLPVSDVHFLKCCCLAGGDS